MDFRHERKHEIIVSDMIAIRHRLRAVAKIDPNAINGKYSIRRTSVCWTWPWPSSSLLADDSTDFINTLSEISGVHSAVLVSYNGDYMG